jgi:alanine racemase
VSELPDPAFTRLQGKRFRRFIELTHAQVCTPFLHASNSAAALHLPDQQFDMVPRRDRHVRLHPAATRSRGSTSAPP